MQAVKTIAEPELSGILRVGQRAFGYLEKNSGKKYLETLSLACCIGLYARSENGIEALSHIDCGGNTGIRADSQALIFLDYMKHKGMNPYEIIIVRSATAVPESISKIYNVLESRKCRNIRGIKGGDSIDILFENGRPYFVENAEKQKKDWQTILDMLNRQGLKCENTGEIIIPENI
ncbi:MAG: hypothetical protein PHO02_00860 [Candidatus Nanoarchaeia archaeon]|nr:hypothetical protein [Candidatus Nanoarchaeia archaeon]